MSKPYWMNADQWDATTGGDTADVHADCKRRLADVTAQRDALLALLGRCDVAMDTAAACGVYSLLPPAHQDSWAETNLAVRDVLAGVK